MESKNKSIVSKELFYYIAVGAGLSLSTSSFLIVSGLYEKASLVEVSLACLLSGVICLLISSGVSELASMYPASPGIRTYIKKAIGDKFSLFLTYSYLIMLVMIAGAESYVFSLVIESVLPGVNALLLVLVLISLVIGLNLIGLQFPMKAQMVSTTILLTSIFCFGIMGIVTADSSKTIIVEQALFNIDWSIIPPLMGMAIFLFIGFEWVSMIGFNRKSYERKIPRAMFMAIGINMVVYSVFTFGIGIVLEPSIISSSSIPHIEHLRELLGTYGLYIGGFLSILAIVSTFNAGLIGGSRFVYALSREGVLPAFCKKVSIKTGVQVGAILALGTLSLLSVLVVHFFQLDLLFALISSCIICFVYSGITASVYFMRKKSTKKAQYVSKSPSFLFIALAAALPLVGIGALLSLPDLVVPALITFTSISLVIILIINKKSQPQNASSQVRNALKK